jgi:N6-adenosine-specific RNA methylase IME4
MTTEQRPIAGIKVGARTRHDLGDLDGLAQSISDIGLLHPIVVAPDGHLIAGERRLRALELLGRDSVSVTVVDLKGIVRGEYAENIFRKQFTPSEVADIADKIEPLERALAKKRMLSGKPCVNRYTGSGKTRDTVAKLAGLSALTITKARAVRDAAQADPKAFGKLQTDMDRTGRVNGPFKRLGVMRQAEVIRREPPPLPGRGPYRVIVADPPWPYEVRSEDPTHVMHPYPCMTIAQICALDVASLAHDDCVLWLWTTNAHMREAFEVLDAWGFSQKTILTWAKNKMGRGDWLRGQTEHALFATRGKPIVEIKNHTTLLSGAVREHSQKPLEFYDLVEAHCPAPRYAYLFSRYRHNEKWDCHGDEAPPAAAE